MATLTATTANGKVYTRNSKKEYSHAWAVCLVGPDEGGYDYGFSATREAAERAAATAASKASKMYPGSVAKSEVMVAVST